MNEIFKLIIVGVVMYLFAWFQAYMYGIKPLRCKLIKILDSLPKE